MYRTKANKTTSTEASQVTVRLADEADAGALVRLAALDSAEVPSAPTLLAEENGRAVAALPLKGGSPVADPFSRTQAVVAMLELRALQLRGEGRFSERGRSRAARLRQLVRAPRARSAR